MESNNGFLGKLEELLVKSEERIDRTNEMFSKCVKVLDTVTTAYSNQLEKLQEARDELIKQNGELIKMMQKHENNSEIISKKYDQLLERMLNMLPKNSSSENNITIK